MIFDSSNYLSAQPPQLERIKPRDSDKKVYLFNKINLFRNYKISEPPYITDDFSNSISNQAQQQPPPLFKEDSKILN
jgi:hypothetical protein